MKMSPVWLIVTMALFSSSTYAADRAWQAEGSGNWSDPLNWQNGILPGATDRAVFSNILPADATVHMDSDTPLVDKIRVANADDTYVRVFTGTQAVNNLEIDTGRAELRGTWSSTANAISSVGMTANRTAYLTLDGDAVFEAHNGHGLYVGYAANASGRVTVRDHARLSLSTMDTDKGIHIGRSDSSLGSFVQEGGLVEAVGRFYPGYQGYGAYELLGGRLVLPYGAANTRYRLAVQNIMPPACSISVAVQWLPRRTV